MSEYISLGCSLLIIAFLLFGFLWGLIRGLRKTISRGLFLLLISVVLVFVAIPITKSLLSISIDADIRLSDDFHLIGHMSIIEALQSCMEYYLGGDFVSNNPELVEIITILPIIFINSFVYVVLFWIAKIVLIPLNWVFYKLFLAPKKRREKLAFAFDWNFGDESNNQEKLENYQKTEDVIFPKIEDLGLSNQNTTQLQVEKQPQEQTPNIQIHNELNTVENNLNNVNQNPVIKNEDNAPNFTIQDNSKFDPKATTVTENKIIATDNASDVLLREIKNTKSEKPKKIKPKKHRLWGGLVGIAVGLVVSFNTLLPVFGLISIARENSKLELKNLTDSTISMDTVTDGNFSDILNAYDKSAMNYIAKYTGIEALGLIAFDTVTTEKINGKNITLRKEVKALAEVFQEVDNTIGLYDSYIVDGSLRKLTQNELDSLLASVRIVVNKCRNVTFIDTMTSYIIPVISAYLITNNETNFTNNDIVNDLIKDTLLALSQAQDINVLKEINSMLNLTDYVNSQGLLLPIINNELDKPISILSSVSDDFGTQFTNKLLELKIVNTTLPHLLNLGLVMLDETIKVGYETNEITMEQAKTFVEDLLVNTVKVAKSLNEESPIYLTDNSLTAIGKLLSTVKGSETTLKLFDDDTYISIVDFAVGELKNVTNAIVPLELRDSFNNQLLSNFSKVDNWEEEMSTITSALKILRDKELGILGSVVDGADDRQGFKIEITCKESVIENIGKAFDELEKSVLFGTETNQRVSIDAPMHKATAMSYIVTDLFDYIGSSVSNDIDISSILDIMKNNLIESDHTVVENVKFWQNELGQIAPLFVELYNMIDAGKIEITDNLGVVLDKARSGNAVLLGGDATLELMRESLGMVEDNFLGENFEYNSDESTQTIDDKIYEAFRDIKTNLESSQVKAELYADNNFWTKEISRYVTLIDIADQIENIDSISKAKTISKDLDEVFESTTIPKSSIANIIAFVIEDVATDVTVGIDGEVNTVLRSIATDLKSPNYFVDKDLTNFWQIEFDHMDRLYSLELENFADDTTTSDVDESSVVEHLDYIGEELDKVVYGYTINITDDPNTPETEFGTKNIRQSYLISYDNVRNILNTAISENKSQMLDSFGSSDPDDAENTEIIKMAVEKVLDGVNTNLQNVTNISFKKELTHIQTLGRLKIDTSVFEYTENNTKLSPIGVAFDSIAFNTKNDSYDTEINSRLITRDMIHTMIIDILPIAKINEVAIDKSIASMGTNLKHIRDNDELFSWVTELGFVNKLMSLKDFTNLSTSTVQFSEFGVTLDAIAFNRTTDYTTFDDSINSKLITRTNINTLIYDLCDTAKSATETDAINNTIESLKYNILSMNDKIFSWERELGFIDILMELKDNSTITSDNYEYIGLCLDTIAFKVWPEPVDGGLEFADCEFNENTLVKQGGNSLLITREMLNKNIASIIVNADAKGNKIIENALGRISTSINTNSQKIYSWVWELDFVNKLIELNNTNIESVDDVDGRLTALGNNIDSIGFVMTANADGTKTGYDDNTYDSFGRLTYLGLNSIIITREILRDSVADFLSSAKTKNPEKGSEKEIINDIIDNATAKINITNTLSNDYYDSFMLSVSINYNNNLPDGYQVVLGVDKTRAFADLISVKKTIEDNNTNTKNQSISNLDATVFADIDSMLNDLQSKLICGNITTRKVARLILVNLQSEMYSVLGKSVYDITESGIYLAKLLEHYYNNISNDSSENYITGTGEFDKPFQTLKTKTI